MLVLSRKVGQRITIGSGIEVVVVRAANSNVRLGIEAPDDVPIHRGELRRRMTLDVDGPTTDTTAVGNSPR